MQDVFFIYADLVQDDDSDVAVADTRRTNLRSTRANRRAARDDTQTPELSPDVEPAPSRRAASTRRRRRRNDVCSITVFSLALMVCRVQMKQMTVMHLFRCPFQHQLSPRE